MDEMLYVGAGFISALILCIIGIKLLCNFGELGYMQNPQDDPDNPYILQFKVNPLIWLNKKYIVLEIRKKY